MSDSVHEARLEILDYIIGVLLDLADFDAMEEAEKPPFAEQMGDVAEMLLDVLGFEVLSYDEQTGEVAAKLTLAYDE